MLTFANLRFKLLWEDSRGEGALNWRWSLEMVAAVWCYLQAGPGLASTVTCLRSPMVTSDFCSQNLFPSSYLFLTTQVQRLCLTCVLIVFIIDPWNAIFTLISLMVTVEAPLLLLLVADLRNQNCTAADRRQGTRALQFWHGCTLIFRFMCSPCCESTYHSFHT